VISDQEMVERALALSKTDDCIVIVDDQSSANLRWATNNLTTNGVTRSRALTVIALHAGAAGVVARSGVADDGIEDVVRRAEAAAKASSPAEDAQALVADATTAGWDGEVQRTSMATFSTVAPALGAAFAESARSDRLLFGFANHGLVTTFVGSSAGLRLRHTQATGLMELNAKSADYARSAWLGVPTIDFSDVDVQAAVVELARRLDWAGRRIDLPAGRYEVVLPPSAVADLMVDLYWSAGARDAHDGQTVFSKAGGGTRVGERLTDVDITIRSDPGAEGLACAPFTIAHASGPMQSVWDNGLALAPTRWIDGGILSALIQTRHSAALTGLPVTGDIDNLIMEGPAGGRSLDSMVSATGDGLLLTCLWYIREVDPETLLLTGLTRDGVYQVRGGEVVGAVSPVSLLARATEIGATERTLPREWSDYFTRAAMPPMRIPDFNMSSVSPAS
jgi:predicted Zn-dependent protease